MEALKPPIIPPITIRCLQVCSMWMMTALRGNVLVVGAGGIGRHHLYALETLSETVEIFAFDPSLEALNLAKLDLRKRLGNQPRHFGTQILSSLPRNIDLAIISTTANHRLRALEDIISQSEIHAVLLEKPISGCIEDLDELEALLKNVANVWVNYPRRLSDLHIEAKRRLHRDQKFEARVTIHNQGLVTNIFHIIDWFSWTFEQSIRSVEIQTNEKGWFESKRPGFYEFSGAVELQYLDESFLEVLSETNEGPENVEISIFQNNLRLTIDEESSTLSLNDSRSIHRGVEYQSRLTNSFARAVLSGHSVGLTPLHEAATNERNLLRAFQSAWPGSLGEKMRIT